ncbi:hypothetical protein SAMN05216439_0699 [Methanobrevibacter gottschalkii]|uniref:Big-1 domain-containing protein n=1 Tax=Methanobrevibacter gottschalkii TaxID=190974 RepID=A0A1H7FQ64_9EURY|nr:carboxypeptidase-like regulatory domain-containing protein [Methanobrevibacter gottschalkii]SEK26300.1 hypothetical protein SAMN05216439_0699 [Methanobrevibacter gottschalkii]
MVLLSTGVAFAISENDVAVSNDVGIVNETVLEVSSDDSDLSEADVLETQTNVVTKDTFHNYFGNDGTLLDNVSSDELIFKGDFTGIDVSYMTIGKSVKLSGGNTTLNNVTFIIGADNVVIDGFVLDHSDVYLFDIENVNGVTLSNNIINFKTLEGTEGYAIFANTVNDFKIINNTINYVGNTKGTMVNNAIRVTGDEDSAIASKKIIVEGNVINIKIPSVDVGYDPVTWESKVFSEGIVFYYCEDVKFIDNRVDLKYNNFSGGFDTIYALSVRGNPYNFENTIVSSDIEIINNTINANGHNYIYTIFLSANDFKLFNNVINSTADFYYANGINIDGPASEGIVSNNLISVESPYDVYGIYSYQMNGPIEYISYVNNTIIGKSYVGCGMEIVECNPYIADNLIIMNGNYTFGVVASIRDNGTISNNSISSLGNNNGTNGTGDSILPLNSLAISTKGDVIIKDNEIVTSGIGVKTLKGNVDILGNDIRTTGNHTIEAINSNLTVKNNYLVSKKAVGTDSIVSDKEVISANNTPALKTIISAPNIFTEYIKGAVFPVAALDENGDPISDIVLFLTMDGIVYNVTTDANGYAAFLLNPDSGIHNVVVSFNGNEVYGPKSVNSIISVDASASKIVAKTSTTVYLTSVKSGSYFNIAVKDVNGKGLANKKVSIYFNGKTKSYTTNSLGVIKFKLSANKIGNYQLKMKFAGDKNYTASTAIAKIKVIKQATKLTVAKKTFKAKTKVKKYTITLKDNKGKAIKKAKVTIKVKGKVYKAVTNSKGKATFKITKLAKKGTYKAYVKFAGNKYYKVSSKSVKISVKR